MSEKKEKIFADGFSFKRREDAPDFVVGQLGVKVADATAFLKKHAKENGWVDLNILLGRSGNPYVELDTYVPKEKGATVKKAEAEAEPDGDEGLPF